MEFENAGEGVEEKPPKWDVLLHKGYQGVRLFHGASTQWRNSLEKI